MIQCTKHHSVSFFFSLCETKTCFITKSVGKRKERKQTANYRDATKRYEEETGRHVIPFAVMFFLNLRLTLSKTLSGIQTNWRKQEIPEKLFYPLLSLSFGVLFTFCCLPVTSLPFFPMSFIIEKDERGSCRRQKNEPVFWKCVLKSHTRCSLVQGW